MTSALDAPAVGSVPAARRGTTAAAGGDAARRRFRPKRSPCPRHIVPAPQPRAIETVRRRRPMTPRQRRRRHCRRESEGTAVSGDVPLRSRRTTLRVAAQLDGRAPPRATVRLRRRALRLLHRAPRRSTVRRDCCQRRPHDRPRRRPCNPAPPPIAATPAPRALGGEDGDLRYARCGRDVAAGASPQRAPCYARASRARFAPAGEWPRSAARNPQRRLCPRSKRSASTRPTLERKTWQTNPPAASQVLTIWTQPPVRTRLQIVRQ